jgi:hypothetical protein
MSKNELIYVVADADMSGYWTVLGLLDFPPNWHLLLSVLLIHSPSEFANKYFFFFLFAGLPGDRIPVEEKNHS